jgi:orotidine-5'-phosphate decarboxylase
MGNQKPQLIVALDVSSLGEVRSLMAHIDDFVEYFKVGSQLFTACGPAAVRFILARGKNVFLDLKFHDIPNTVARAVVSAVSLGVEVDRNTDYYQPKPGVRRGISMYTVHTCGGLDMLKAAVVAGQETSAKLKVTPPLAVGVTVLTSEGNTDNMLSLVLQRAELAKKAGLDGVVASCQEAPVIRREFGNDFIIVTPGIRPKGADVQDQQRVATPAIAVQNGSSFLVVGRPIVEAADPRQAAKMVTEEMQGAGE